MTERPILFSGPMVRAILDGRKTQTRRVCKLQPQVVDVEPRHKPHTWGFWHDDHDKMRNGLVVRCPYGQPGDRLWVRETWGVGTRPHHIDGWTDGIEYRADEPYCDDVEPLPLYTPKAPAGFYEGYDKRGWRPSIHMPRWACRLLLDVKAVRVERLQDISRSDCYAEGLIADNQPMRYNGEPAQERFAALWDGLNAKRGHGWDTNPWVWVIEFSVVQGEQSSG